jgi:hypothetical protein
VQAVFHFPLFLFNVILLNFLERYFLVRNDFDGEVFNEFAKITLDVSNVNF